MALIVIILSLFIERFLGSLEELRSFDWFTRYCAWLCQRLPKTPSWEGPLALTLVLAGPFAGVLLLTAMLANLSFLLVFLFAIVALLYSLGPRDLEAEVEAFVDASERDDNESAAWHASVLLGKAAPDSTPGLYRAITENILTEANERILAIIFWFVILGPAGALLYRLTAQLRERYASADSAFADAVQRLHFILAWLPVRLCALAYVLGGSFVDAMHGWRNTVADEHDANRNVLLASGLGALRFDPVDDTAETDEQSLLDEVKEAMALVRRAVMVYLALLAVLILSGWTF